MGKYKDPLGKLYTMANKTSSKKLLKIAKALDAEQLMAQYEYNKLKAERDSLQQQVDTYPACTDNMPPEDDGIRLTDEPKDPDYMSELTADYIETVDSYISGSSWRGQRDIEYGILNHYITRMIENGKGSKTMNEYFYIKKMCYLLKKRLDAAFDY